MTLPRACRAIHPEEFSKWMTTIYNQIPAMAARHDMHGSLDQAPRWGIALSGGVDSMALATLLSQHVHQQQQRTFDAAIRIHAMIVNHNLRDRSKEEAEYVASLVQRLGGS
ncbi:hypothetical protein DFQ27_006818 [Actinomortierella ambigua]|uniref:tRNA(Ile)-lysidine/2-thiocytidine synthase N-terminal domain-containing protein n=1 Tax=Actinomortierella ambigua TaxID=1343610 RepID=A0A9P6U0Y9_9FUNG|nr:hypothetical protein DFQ27_006818 [Actinomortierella ambigua]